MHSLKKVLIIADGFREYAAELSTLSPFAQRFYHITLPAFLEGQQISTFDLILLDCDRDIRKGLEALKKIKKDNPHNLVLLIGECNSVDCIISVFRHGARDFVRKPVDFDGLRKIITILYKACGGSHEKRSQAVIAEERSLSTGSQDEMTSLMNDVIRYVDSSLSNDIYIDQLAQVAGLSKYHFIRRFKKLTGYTPHKYVIKKRIEKAQEMLRRQDGAISISRLSARLGFSYVSDFSHHFKKITGSPPSHFRKSTATARRKKG